MVGIDDILAKLDPKTQAKYRLAKDVSKEVIPTASIGINMLIGGGVGVGKQSTFWGNQSAGKSALWLQSIALNQKLGRGCAYIDAEKTFDPDWAARLGVNIDELLVAQPSSISEYTDISRDFIRAGIELEVLDSTSALMPNSFYDDNGELKPFDKTGQIGQFAKELGQSCRMIQGENFSCAMVHISQVRMDLGGFKPGQKPSGGKEVEHANSLTVRMFSSKADGMAVMGDLEYGDIVLKEQIGRQVKWSIDKNKINGAYGEGNYDLYFRGKFVGVDRAGELIDYGTKFGHVEKSGNWIKFNGENFNGKGKAVEYLRANPEVAEKLEVDIIGKSV